MRRVLGSSGGFTYIAALVMVMIVGIMATKGTQVWVTKMQREREIEMISRGIQVRDAMRRWYDVRVVEGKLARISPKTPPDPRPNLNSLEALLKDPNSTSTARYLRPSALIDPVTGEDWDVIKDASQKIIGVKSKSEKEPIKKGNFPFDLHPADFEVKQRYSDWHFIYDRIPPGTSGGAVTGLGGTGSPGTGAAPPATGQPH